MARKKKPAEPSIEEQIRLKVSELLTTPTITPALVHELLLLGHRMYKWNGIPNSTVWESISAGFADNDRHYLTPDQTAALLNKPLLSSEDLEYLSK